MSRTGKKPIPIPEKVKVRLENQLLWVEGPLGKGKLQMNPYITVSIEGQKVMASRKDDSREARAAHGLVRSLISNLIKGVTEGFTSELQIEGVGYRADVSGSLLKMTLGYSHPIDFKIPEGIKIAVEKQTKLTLTGSNKALVGETAAVIRSFRPPEPYKGKGIRYAGEIIKKKVGKAAAAAAGAGGK